ncbi:MAG: hypothetical protein WBX15_03080 [Thermoanaerobaculia bacterium]
MFKETLEGVFRRVDGTLAVSLLGLDGIAVETVGGEGVSLETWSAELGAFVKSLQLSINELDSGDLRQFTLATDRHLALFSAVTSDYFILMILSPDGNFGRARFELRKARFDLQDELS